MKKEFTVQAEIKKADEDKRIVYAWAYVCESDGKQVVDHSEEYIEADEMEKMAFDFMESYRDGGDSHERTGVAIAVGSMPFTKELQDVLGIDIGKIGWLVVFKVTDEEVWQKIKDGTYSMMSIGGSAMRDEGNEG